MMVNMPRSMIPDGTLYEVPGMAPTSKNISKEFSIPDFTRIVTPITTKKVKMSVFFIDPRASL
jgi:hypothetical protein